MATKSGNEIILTKSELKDLIKEAIEEDRKGRDYPKEVRIVHEKSWSQRIWDLAMKD